MPISISMPFYFFLRHLLVSPFLSDTCKFFFSISIVYDGLGQVLVCLGIIIFLLLFHCNLRTIKEPQKIQKSWTPFSSPQFFKACLVALSICTMTVFFQNDSIIITHIQLLLYIATVGIFIPKTK